MNKRKLAKIIEWSSIGLVVLLVIVIALSTIIPSYTSWKRKDDLLRAPKPPKTVLQSIDAELAEGKIYYDNNLASVKNEDLKVTANYLTGEEKSSELLAADAYTVSVPADFAVNGGDVTVEYKQKKATVSVGLEPVVLMSLEMTQSPYTVAYKTGDRFSCDGMEIYAVYNDGSKKAITSIDYVTDIVSPLSNGAQSHRVTYTDGETMVEYEVPIKVSDDFSNGRIVSISAAGDCYAAAGDDISKVKPLVKCTYESGNSKLTDAYTVTNAPETVVFGKEYLLTVTYNGDARKKAEIPVTVRNHVEGEDTTIVGGSVKSEASYTFEKGKFTATDETPSFAGSFAKAVQNGEEASVTFSVESYTDCVANITLNCGNSYITRDNDGYYWMQPLQINTILDMTVNGEPVAIGNNVVLKGCGPSAETTNTSSNYAPLYGVYYRFTFEDIQLQAGGNLIKLEFKNSTEGATTCWNESPSTMNIDWINIDTKGTVVDESATITAIEVSDNFEIKYGDEIEKILGTIPVTATMSDGTRRKIEGNRYTVKVTEGDTADGWFKFGVYTFEATLKENEELKATGTVELETYYHSLVTKADIVQEGEKVYWVFEFENVGYTAEDYEMFNDGNVKYEFTGTLSGAKALIVKIDVTDFAAGTYNPHAKVDGENYYNGGANANGDLRGDQLVYPNGKTVTYNGKTYKLQTNYSMPALVIS